MNCSSITSITSNVFQKGHRMRVQISATFLPEFLAQSAIG